MLEAKGDDVNRYQVAKQADVAMLFFLFLEAEIEALLQRLGYSFDQNQMQNTITYHLQRTSHESSLSHYESIIYLACLSGRSHGLTARNLPILCFKIILTLIFFTLLAPVFFGHALQKCGIDNDVIPSPRMIG